MGFPENTAAIDSIALSGKKTGIPGTDVNGIGLLSFGYGVELVPRFCGIPLFVSYEFRHKLGLKMQGKYIPGHMALMNSFFYTFWFNDEMQSISPGITLDVLSNSRKISDFKQVNPGLSLSLRNFFSIRSFFCVDIGFELIREKQAKGYFSGPGVGLQYGFAMRKHTAGDEPATVNHVGVVLSVVAGCLIGLLAAGYSVMASMD